MIILYLLSIVNVSQYGLGEYVGTNKPFSPITNPADMNFNNVHFSVTGMFEYSETGNYGFVIRDGLFSIPFKNAIGVGVSYNEIYDDNYGWQIFSDTLQRDTLTQSISGIGEIGKYSVFLSGKLRNIHLGISYSRIFGTPMEIWKLDFAHTQDVYDTLYYKVYGSIYNIGISYGDYNRIGIKYTYPDSFTTINCDNTKSRRDWVEKIFFEVRLHINKNLYIDALYGTSHITKVQISGHRFYLRGEMLGTNFNNGASRYLGCGYTFQFPHKRRIKIGIDIGDIGGSYPDRLIRGEVSYIFNENW